MVQLKEFLRYYELPVSGRKDALIARLKTARDISSPERPPPPTTTAEITDDGDDSSGAADFSAIDLSFTSSASTNVQDVSCDGGMDSTITPSHSHHQEEESPDSSSPLHDTTPRGGATNCSTDAPDGVVGGGAEDANSFSETTPESNKVLSLRERLQARAKEREALQDAAAAARQAERRGKHITKRVIRSGNGSGSGKDTANSKSAGDQTKSCVTPAAASAAAATARSAVEATAPTRKPLGVLDGLTNVSCGNSNSSSSSRSGGGGGGGGIGEGRSMTKAKAGMPPPPTSFKRTSGENIRGTIIRSSSTVTSSSAAAMKRERPSHQNEPTSGGPPTGKLTAPSPSSSARAGAATNGATLRGAVKRAAVEGNSGRKVDDGRSRALASVNNSGRRVGRGKPELGVVGAKHTSNKRIKLEERGGGTNGSVASSSTRTPSYLKPTMSTGAQARRAVHPRSSGTDGNANKSK